MRSRREDSSPCQVCGGEAFGFSDLCREHRGFEECRECRAYFEPDQLEEKTCLDCRHECAVYCGECGEPLDECDGSFHEQANAPEASKALRP